MIASKLGRLIQGLRGQQPRPPDGEQEVSATSNDELGRGTVVVRLRPGHRPHGEVEHYLHAVLTDGPLPLNALVDQIAERLFQMEVARGGWATDIGILGPDAFKPAAADSVRALDGLMLSIEPAGAQTTGS